MNFAVNHIETDSTVNVAENYSDYAVLIATGKCEGNTVSNGIQDVTGRMKVYAMEPGSLDE